MLTQAEIRGKVIAIVTAILPDEDLKGIKDDVTLKEQYGMDSMDLLDIAMEIRKKFNITIPDTELVQLSTLKGCVEYIHKKLSP
jgi:acyl carrier protein